MNKSMILLSMILVVIGCGGESTGSSSGDELIGDWSGSDTFMTPIDLDDDGVDESELELDVVFDVSFKAASAYTYTVTVSGIAAWSEAGTFSLSGSKISFNPKTCLEYDEDKEDLISTDCDPAYKIGYTDGKWTIEEEFEDQEVVAEMTKK